MNAIMEFLRKHVGVFSADARAECEARLNAIWVQYEDLRSCEQYRAELERHYIDAENQFMAGEYDACAANITEVERILPTIQAAVDALADRAEQVLPKASSATRVAEPGEQAQLQKAREIFNVASSRKELMRANTALDVMDKLATNILAQARLVKGPGRQPLEALSEDEEDQAAAREAELQAARTRYEQARARLQARLAQANLLDAEQQLAHALARVDVALGRQQYTEARAELDNAGQIATALISGAPKAHAVGVAEPARTKGLDAATRAHDQVNVYYADTPEKRAESAVQLDGKGLLRDADGDLVDGSKGFVVSAAEGTMHTFQTAGRKEGRVLHHSSEVAGGDVTAAGEITTDEGVIREIRDQSGHYRPDSRMTHRFVADLQARGAQMRDQTLYETDDAGNWIEAEPETVEDWQKVQGLPAMRALLAEYQKERAETEDTPENATPIRIIEDDIADAQEAIAEAEALIPVLAKRGVGPRNKDANVQVYDPATRITAEEWARVQGNADAVKQLVVRKVGTQLEPGRELPEAFMSGAAIDANNLDATNDYIGTLMRAADVAGQEWMTDKNVTHVQLDAERFAQTGGNIDAVKGKRAVNDQILARQILKLGGEKRLREIGVQDLTKYSLAQQLQILKKGRLPPVVDPALAAFKNSQLSVYPGMANAVGLPMDRMNALGGHSGYVGVDDVAAALGITVEELFALAKPELDKPTLGAVAAVAAAAGQDSDDDEEDDAEPELTVEQRFEEWRVRDIKPYPEIAQAIGVSVEALEQAVEAAGWELYPADYAPRLGLSVRELFDRILAGGGFNPPAADADTSADEPIVSDDEDGDDDPLRSHQGNEDGGTAAEPEPVEPEPAPDFDDWVVTYLKPSAFVASRLGVSLAQLRQTLEDLDEPFADDVARSLGMTPRALYDRIYG